MLGALKRQIADHPVQRPTLCPTPSPKPRRKPRSKSYPVYRLYPAAEPEPQAQAETLLGEIQKHAEDSIGKYIPSSDLQRLYLELCEREGWEARHWSVLGHALGRITQRVVKKVHGRRFHAYRIPRAA